MLDVALIVWFEESNGMRELGSVLTVILDPFLLCVIGLDVGHFAPVACVFGEGFRGALTWWVSFSTAGRGDPVTLRFL